MFWCLFGFIVRLLSCSAVRLYLLLTCLFLCLVMSVFAFCLLPFFVGLLLCCIARLVVFSLSPCFVISLYLLFVRFSVLLPVCLCVRLLFCFVACWLVWYCTDGYVYRLVVFILGYFLFVAMVLRLSAILESVWHLCLGVACVACRLVRRCLCCPLDCLALPAGFLCQGMPFVCVFPIGFVSEVACLLPVYCFPFVFVCCNQFFGCCLIACRCTLSALRVSICLYLLLFVLYLLLVCLAFVFIYYLLFLPVAFFLPCFRVFFRPLLACDECFPCHLCCLVCMLVGFFCLF